MKIIFNDAAELQVQQVYVDPAGALRIKTISAAQEELVQIFSNQEKTKKITVQERGQTLTEYEKYTRFDGIMSYTGGILEPVLYKEGETPTEKINRLESEKQALQNTVEILQNTVNILQDKADMLQDNSDMLQECILEMSERVYQ